MGPICRDAHLMPLTGRYMHAGWVSNYINDQIIKDKDDRLGSWARKWGMRFQPVKCNMMQLTNKRTSKIQASYKLEGTVLENVESIKYLGVTITKDLKWNTHISNVCTKANRTLGFFLDKICFLAPKM